MTCTHVVPIPPPEDLKKRFPLSHKGAAFVHHSRQEIQRILFKDDPRMLLIVGPCSVHHPEALIDYALKIQALQKQVEGCFYIALRAYVEKPRTSDGWKGFLLDPNLDGSHAVTKGLEKTRQLFQKLTELNLPLCGELLELDTHNYYSDFLSWGCIGARTSSSSPHRQLASLLPFPVGFKNTIEGSLKTPLHAVSVARKKQTFLGSDEKGRLSALTSAGNPWGHVVLRGSLAGPNYFQKDIDTYLETRHKLRIDAPLIIDCSHDNCRKLPQFQIPAFFTAIQHFQHPERKVRGAMLESFLMGGNQFHGKEVSKELSITDPCLSFDQTKELILKGAERLKGTHHTLR